MLTNHTSKLFPSVKSQNSIVPDSSKVNFDLERSRTPFCFRKRKRVPFCCMIAFLISTRSNLTCSFTQKLFEVSQTCFPTKYLNKRHVDFFEAHFSFLSLNIWTSINTEFLNEILLCIRKSRYISTVRIVV